MPDVAVPVPDMVEPDRPAVVVGAAVEVSDVAEEPCPEDTVPEDPEPVEALPEPGAVAAVSPVPSVPSVEDDADPERRVDTPAPSPGAPVAVDPEGAVVGLTADPASPLPLPYDPPSPLPVAPLSVRAPASPEPGVVVGSAPDPSEADVAEPPPDCGAVPAVVAGPASVGIAATTLPSDAAAHCGAVVPAATGSCW